jgi:hypothetical protein
MAGLLDRVKVATATTGTGTVTLGAATSPYQAWAAAGAINGVSYSYLIEDGTAWELGWGIYSSTGPTLTRNLISSSTGSLINLSGSATAACVANEMDIAPLVPVPQIANNYIHPDSLSFSTGTSASLTGTAICFYPFSRLAKVDAVAIEVTTLSAGNNVRGALYTYHPTTGLPHLLIEEGAIQSTATTGIKAMTFAAARWIDRPVYIAVAFSAAVTCRNGTVQYANSLGMNTLNSSAPYTRLNGAVASFGAMPADVGSLVYTPANATLMAALRLTA